MSTERPGPRLAVTINGERMPIAGLQNRGVVGASITWVRRIARDAAEQIAEGPDFDPDEFACDEIDFHLGGLDSVQREHVVWHNGPLAIGDRITIEILDSGESADPQERKPHDDVRRQYTQKYFEHIEREYHRLLAEREADQRDLSDPSDQAE